MIQFIGTSTLTRQNIWNMKRGSQCKHTALEYKRGSQFKHTALEFICHYLNIEYRYTSWKLLLLMLSKSYITITTKPDGIPRTFLLMLIYVRTDICNKQYIKLTSNFNCIIFDKNTLSPEGLLTNEKCLLISGVGYFII